jgi:phosphoglycerate dehydrogenase-like enzyme
MQAGRIRGAVLDVFEHEPLSPDSPLWKLRADKLLLTPHCADNVPDYWDSAARICVDNIQRFITGEPLRNLVDKGLGY